MEQILNQISQYWYIPGGATLLIGGVFYVFDKFCYYDEKEFLNNCMLEKNNNLSKKAKLLAGFVEHIKSNFDNLRESQNNDTYDLFLRDMARHGGYDLVLDKLRARFKFFRTALLIIILISFLSFIVGFLFEDLRISLSLLNTILVIFAVAIFFFIRGLCGKLDDLRNEPNLLQ